MARHSAINTLYSFDDLSFLLNFSSGFWETGARCGTHPRKADHLARLRARLSQVDVAKRIGKSKQLASAWEAGRAEMTATTLGDFARIVSADANWLLLGMQNGSNGVALSTLPQGNAIPLLSEAETVKYARGKLELSAAPNQIYAACQRAMGKDKGLKAILDPYNPRGSTTHVSFNTSKELLWTTAADKCHVNYVVCDSEWEAELARVVEAHPRVKAYVKNQGLQFEVPYRDGGNSKKYLPDFIVQVDDGNGPDDLLNIVVETKGYRGLDAQLKAETMSTQWVPGVNNLGTFGRWAFAEFRDVYET